MQSMVLILELGGLRQGKKEIEFNERIAEKEKDGWEVVEMQTTRPSFGISPTIIVRLTRESK